MWYLPCRRTRLEWRCWRTLWEAMLINSWTAPETLAVWYDFTAASSSGISGSRSNSADTCALVYSFLISSGSIVRLEIPTREFCRVKRWYGIFQPILLWVWVSSPTVQVGDRHSSAVTCFHSSLSSMVLLLLSTPPFDSEWCGLPRTRWHAGQNIPKWEITPSNHYIGMM